MKLSDKQTPTRLSKYDPAKLTRYLSPVDVWAIAFGCIIGWGAFVMPGTTFLPIAGPFGTFLSMVIGACIMLVIGKNYVYLMQKYPGTGGVYNYTKQAFGRDHAFLCSWFLALSYLSIVFLNATALFVVCRTLFGDLLQVGFHYRVVGYDVYSGELALAAAALLVIGLLFIFRKPLLQYIHTVLALALIVGAVALVIIALPHFKVENLFQFSSSFRSGNFMAVFVLVVLAPWAFVGFDVASLETAHYRFPMKKSGKIIYLSIAFGAFVYIAMTLISVTATPSGFSSWQEYVANIDSLSGIETVTTFFVANAHLGKAGLVIVGIAAFSAIFTGIIGAYRATTRILSTMAEDKIISNKFLMTSFCIVFIMIISIVISFLGRNALNWFVELTSFCAVIGFGYTSASAMKIAKANNDRTVFATGVVGLIVSGVFAVVHMASKVDTVSTMSAPSFLLLAVWCLIGFAFYWRTMKHSPNTEFNGISTSSIVLFCLLFYSTLMWYVKSILAVVGTENSRELILKCSIILMTVVGLGLAVMLYVQTALRNRHQKLEREKIHAEESSKAKSQFLFNMSHDIRTPMNAIVGYAHLADQEKNIPPTIKEYLEKIKISSNHLLSLINDILEMGQIENGSFDLVTEPNNLFETVNSAYEMFRTQMEEKHIDYTFDSAGLKDVWAEFDKNRLTRAVLNLLSNAYKFTPEGGSVALKLKQKNSANEDLGVYELSVRDSGIGMTKEFAENVFEVFARERTSTVSRIQGTGLGMAITKGIVEAMGGTIAVDTAPGKGTQFTINVSFALTKEMAETHEQTDAAQIDISGTRILLVEDNEVNREIAKMILLQAGCEVETAENGLDAFEKVESNEAGRFDIVLMDIQMPVMDGYTATAKIRALDEPQKANLPIVAITANAFREDAIAALEAGMQAHIAKPLDVDKMMKTLSDILNQNSRGE